MIALGVIVIIVVAIVVGVLLATRGGGGGSGGTIGTVAGASSLQYSVDITNGGTSTTYTYSAKNIGTSNEMLRIEATGSEANLTYIINGAQQQAWIYEDGTWNNLTALFPSYWSIWNSTFRGYTNYLSHWSGTGDYTYTIGAESVRIYNISVNPSLPDSMFEHS